METLVNDPNFDVKKLRRVRNCQEGVKYERRNLEWIREERAKQEKVESDAASPTADCPV